MNDMMTSSLVLLYVKNSTGFEVKAVAYRTTTIFLVRKLLLIALL